MLCVGWSCPDFLDNNQISHFISGCSLLRNYYSLRRSARGCDLIIRSQGNFYFWVRVKKKDGGSKIDQWRQLISHIRDNTDLVYHVCHLSTV